MNNITYNMKVKLKWFAFVIPSLILYIIFFIVPIAQTSFYAFTDWSGGDYEFVGLENFINMFHDVKVIASISNTAMYSISVTILQNVLGLSIAMLLTSKIIGKKYLRMLFFMPIIFAQLVVGYIWGFILEPNVGTLNTALNALNLDFMAGDWLGNPVLGRWMIIVVMVWQNAGYSMVIYIAGISAIPQEVYEAGEIDGVNSIGKFRHITFPLIAPSLTINLILCTIGTLKIYDAVVSLTGGGPGYTTSSIASMIYRLGFGSDGGRWGYGCAMSIVLFVCIMIISTIQVIVLRKREVEM